MFNLQQFIIVRLKGLLGILGFLAPPRDRALQELFSSGDYDSHPYTQDYTSFHKAVATASAHVWAQSKNPTSEKQRCFTKNTQGFKKQSS